MECRWFLQRKHGAQRAEPGAFHPHIQKQVAQGYPGSREAHQAWPFPRFCLHVPACFPTPPSFC